MVDRLWSFGLELDNSSPSHTASIRALSELLSASSFFHLLRLQWDVHIHGISC